METTTQQLSTGVDHGAISPKLSHSQRHAKKDIVKKGYLIKAPMSKGRASLRASPRKQYGFFPNFVAYKRSLRRYFVLEDSTLAYFENENDKSPKGLIRLNPNSVVETIADEQGLVVVPFPGSTKELFLTAENPADLLEWHDCILEACKHGRSEHIDLDGNEEETKDGEYEYTDGEDTGAEDSEAGDESELEDKDLHTSRGNGATERKQIGAKVDGADVNEQDAINFSHKVDRRASTASSTVTDYDETNWKEEWTRRVNPRTRLPNLQYEIVKEGVLHKRSQTFEDRWYTRHFVLTKDLYYYETKEAFEQGKGPRRISLEAFKVTSAHLDGVPAFKLFTLGMTYTLRCETQEDADDWVEKFVHLPKYAMKKSNLKSIPFVDRRNRVVPEFLQALEPAPPNIENRILVVHEEAPRKSPVAPAKSEHIIEDSRFSKLRALRLKISSESPDEACAENSQTTGTSFGSQSDAKSTENTPARQTEFDHAANLVEPKHENLVDPDEDRPVALAPNRFAKLNAFLAKTSEDDDDE